MLITVGYSEDGVALWWSHGRDASGDAAWTEVVTFETEQRFLEWYRRKQAGVGVMKLTGSDTETLKRVLGESCAEKIIDAIGVERPVVSTPAPEEGKDDELA